VTRAILDADAHVDDDAVVGDTADIAVVDSGARITARDPLVGAVAPPWQIRRLASAGL
jgi:hypothetical protein